MKRIEHQKRRRRRPYCFFGSHRATNCRHVPLSTDGKLYEVLAHTGFHPGLIARLIAFCRMLYKGVALSFLIPLGSAVIPLVVSMLGIFVYEESISALKITLLIVACALIGIAGKMK